MAGVFESIVNNPLLQMGVGLMQGAQPGGTFAGGLNMGLQNMMNMQRQQQATALLGAQLQALQAKRIQAENDRKREAVIASQYGVVPGINPTSAMINASALAQGDPAAYQRLLAEQTEKGPLVNNTNIVGPPGDNVIRALSPAEQEVAQSGDPFVDTKGNLKMAPDLPQVQRTAAGFASRMRNAEDLMGRIDFDMTGSLSGRQGILPSELQSDEFQQIEQAQNDWIRAKLRKESGAVISDEEMEGERETYFPQPGDGKQTVIQKRVARVEAEKAMIKEASNAYQGAGVQTEVFRTPTQPTGGKKGDIWITPEGRFYVFE